MKLRSWQTECVAETLDHYQTHQHFLCLATPGAGKTTMAAEVAARLFDENRIDFVLCFSPSLSVAESLGTTFAHRLKRRFDGRLGAAGCSYTYQSMGYLPADFWDLLLENRVLVVFDEIHHCSGSTLENANAWGQEILLNIQSRAQYTLALTGTPWRSDRVPIVLSRYVEHGTRIHCNYVYGLQEAVRDGVCRKPKIVLLDNERVQITQENGLDTKTFESFEQLLSRSRVRYQALITHEPALRHILKLGSEKLSEIRQQNPNAGGLIVTSSVEHAIQVTRLIREELGQSAALVTYKDPHAARAIRNFRYSDAAWIVSVGMVSEGTDIPRLQVCLHLSHVKTELHFRQVLGRILRMSEEVNQEAWLFTFAERKLIEFAGRVQEDLPESSVLTSERLPDDELDLEQTSDTNLEPIEDFSEQEPTIDLQATFPAHSNTNSPLDRNLGTSLAFELLGRFRQEVIASFDSPFRSMDDRAYS